MSFDGNPFQHGLLPEKRLAGDFRSSFELFAALLVSERQEDLRQKDLLQEKLDQIASSLEQLTNGHSYQAASETIDDCSKADPHVLTMAELKERWKVSTATIRRRIRDGKIEVLHIGNGVRILFKSVLEYERNAKQ